VWIFDGTNFAKLTSSNNRAYSSGNIGPEFGIAVRWMRETTTGNLFVMKQTDDGQPISVFLEGGAYFTTQLSWYTAANSWLASHSYTVTDCGWLWVQGESDAGSTQAAYHDSLAAYVQSRLDNGLQTSTSKRILAQMAVSSNAYAPAVVAAKTQYASEHSDTTETLQMLRYMNGDDLHENARGQVQLGIRRLRTAVRCLAHRRLRDSMAWTQLIHAEAGVSASTPARNTTGATLIVVSACYYPPSGVPSTVAEGGASNTWVAGTARASGSLGVRQFYCISPNTNASHTFAVTDCSITVAAYSGGPATPTLFGQSGAAALQPGSLTPAQDGALLVAALGYYAHSSPVSINSGFTISDQADYYPGRLRLRASRSRARDGRRHQSDVDGAGGDGLNATSMLVFDGDVGAGGGGAKPAIYYAQMRQLAS
jgi:hypothetical protein